MKKTILAVLALASVVACNKSEVLEVAPQKAISFGNPFVDNSTKAIDGTFTGSNTPESFKVYGTITNTGGDIANIFNAVEVTKTSKAETDIHDTDTWYYTGDAVQYWIPNNTYNFVAVANANNVSVDKDGMPTTLSYTANGTTDLLYTKASVTKTPNAASFDETVEFTFDHLLSKVVFKFTNKYADATNFEIKVTDIKIVGAIKDGQYSIESEKWSNVSTESFTYEFGNAATTATNKGAAADYIDSDASLYSNFEKLLIPSTYAEMNIAFKAEVYMKQAEKYTLVDTKDYTANYLKPTNITIEEGKAYCFSIEIGDELNPIKFGVKELNDFTTETPDVELN